MEELLNNTLEIVTLSDKQIDSLNGIMEGCFHDGNTVVILPVGEKKHKWSMRLEGPAFKAICFTGLGSVRSGWVSVNNLGSNRIFTKLPTEHKWMPSNDGKWWYAVDEGNTDAKICGLPACGLGDSIPKTTDATLPGAIILHVTKAGHGFVSTVVDAVKHPAIPTEKPWVRKTWYEGEAHFLTKEDLKSFKGKVSDKDIETMRRFIKK